MAVPSPQPRRRRIRITLRVLMLVVVACAAFLGWRVNRVHHQRLGVRAVRAARGSVVYDYQFSNGRPVPNARPWGPLWLRGLTGDEYFQEVTGVTLKRPVNDETLASLEGLDRLDSLVMFYPERGRGLGFLEGMRHLEQVALRGRGVTDESVPHLSQLPRLWKLDLSDSVVTDAGLIPLARFPSLRWLSLRNSEVTDAGLAHLSGLSRLTDLDLSQLPKITDAGLAHLRALSGLRSLHLFQAKLTPTGLRHLGRLKALQRLSLAVTDIDDAGLVHLAALTELDSLDLSTTNITEAGLVHLSGLGKLRKLRLEQTVVSPEGLEKLRAALPGLTVVHYRAPPASKLPARPTIVDPAEDLKELEGTWTAVSLESDGKAREMDERFPIRYEIQSHAIAQYFGSLRFLTEVTNFDSTARPYSIMDLTRGKGLSRQTTLGIYKREGDTLTICSVSRPGDDGPGNAPTFGGRPTDFVTRPGDGRVLGVFQREKARD